MERTLHCVWDFDLEDAARVYNLWGPREMRKEILQEIHMGEQNSYMKIAE